MTCDAISSRIQFLAINQLSDALAFTYLRGLAVCVPKFQSLNPSEEENNAKLWHFRRAHATLVSRQLYHTWTMGPTLRVLYYLTRCIVPLPVTVSSRLPIYGFPLESDGIVCDQVPADGVLISGHSLAIDESNMTCESKISHRRRGENKNSTKEATKNEKGEEGSLKRKKRRNKKK
ncbi:hypothetical protein YC2023_038650 [Brassica napus]